MEKRIQRLDSLSMWLIYIYAAIHIGLVILLVPLPLILHWTDLPFPAWWLFVPFLGGFAMFGTGYYIQEEVLPGLNYQLRIQEEEEQARKAAAQKYQQHLAAAIEAGTTPRRDLHIVGPPVFMRSVNRLLDELREKAPFRYQEVIRYLPKAEYTPYAEGFLGRSDGMFALDGSDYSPFRFVFLHEVGHNVRGQQNGDWSEDAANAYADQVIRETDWWTMYQQLH